MSVLSIGYHENGNITGLGLVSLGPFFLPTVDINTHPSHTFHTHTHHTHPHHTYTSTHTHFHTYLPFTFVLINASSFFVLFSFI